MTPHHPADRSLSPEQLLDELATRHRHVAVLAAHDVLGDWTLAEDAAQLAFLLILKRLRAGDDDLLDANPEAAVRRNARWAAMKLRRRTLRRAEAEQRYGEGGAALVTDHCARSEARLACETVLQRLPDHYRDAIGLRFFRDLSDGDAAASLDVTLRSYRRRLDRAIAAARNTAHAVGLRGAAALLVSLGTLRGLLRRGRERAAELAAQLTGAWSGSAVNVTALVVVGASATAPATMAWASPAPPIASATAPVPAGASVATSRHAVARALPASAAASSRSATVVPPAKARTAWDETPEDTQVWSAAASPGSDGGGAVVGLGWGKSCACSVMLQSTDAGRTWSAAPGPAPTQLMMQAMRVTLPPTYPGDPRIFIGAPWSSTVPDMVAQRFGDAFTPLPMSGWITLPPSFESDGTMLFAHVTAVLQLRLGAPAGAPLVFQPPLVGTPVVMAPRSGPDSVFVLTDQPAALSGPAPAAGLSPSAAGDMRTMLYRCGTGPVCNAIASPPISGGQVLAVSDRYASDGTVAVANGDEVALSRNRGSSFTVLPDPGDTVGALEVTSDATGPVLWATLSGSAGTGVARWDATHGWVHVLPTRHMDFWGTDWPSAMLLDPSRALLRGTLDGLLCTADGGRTWATRCP